MLCRTACNPVILPCWLYCLLQAQSTCHNIRQLRHLLRTPDTHCPDSCTHLQMISATTEARISPFLSVLLQMYHLPSYHIFKTHAVLSLFLPVKGADNQALTHQHLYTHHYLPSALLKALLNQLSVS